MTSLPPNIAPPPGAGRHAQRLAAFVAQATWLTADDGPAVMLLESLADELDKEVTAALAGQFGLAYRNLLGRKPKVDAKPDPTGAALEGALGG